MENSESITINGVKLYNYNTCITTDHCNIVHFEDVMKDSKYKGKTLEETIVDIEKRLDKIEKLLYQKNI